MLKIEVFVWLTVNYSVDVNFKGRRSICRWKVLTKSQGIVIISGSLVKALSNYGF